MYNNYTDISRVDLYNEVWQTSMVQLAERYGVSDRGLAKICARNNIPTPPRGYWAKVCTGLVLL